MAFDKYKDGAWQEPEEHVSRYDESNGYWVECESAKRYKNDAWTEIWANFKWFSLLSNTIDTGACYLNNEGTLIDLYKIMGYQNDKMYGTISGDGKMILYLDGEWTNPTISFNYYGGFMYKLNPNDGNGWYLVSAGTVSLYSRTKDGVENITQAVTQIGETQGQVGYVTMEEKTYTDILEGTYDRIGLVIAPNSFSGTYFNAALEIKLHTVLINGRKVGFPTNAAYDYQEWP